MVPIGTRELQKSEFEEEVSFPNRTDMRVFEDAEDLICWSLRRPSDRKSGLIPDGRERCLTVNEDGGTRLPLACKDFVSAS